MEPRDGSEDGVEAGAEQRIVELEEALQLRRPPPALYVREGSAPEVVRKDTGGHAAGWAELWALATGDGPQLRPTQGGTYRQLHDPRPRSQVGQDAPNTLVTRYCRDTLSGRLQAEAAAVEPGRTQAARDKFSHAVAMQRRGHYIAAAAAYSAAAEAGHPDSADCEFRRATCERLAQAIRKPRVVS